MLKGVKEKYAATSSSTYYESFERSEEDELVTSIVNFLSARQGKKGGKERLIEGRLKTEIKGRILVEPVSNEKKTV